MTGRRENHEKFLQATLGHADVLHALARRLAPNSVGAADIVQETYLRAYAAWCRRRPDDTGAWLATICLNVGRDELRRHARRTAAVQPGPVPDVASNMDTAEQALNGDANDRVQAVLMTLPEVTLPEVQRIAITLMDLCGFTAQQISVITCAPRGTVLARFHRGRKSLALTPRANRRAVA